LLFVSDHILLSQTRPGLLVAAAADLAPAEGGLRVAFRQATGAELTFVLASSGMLARQIDQGAPYDVYLSANEVFIEDLAKSGRLIPGSVRVYALGRIGLWSKDRTLRSVADLADAHLRHVAIPNPAHAPYGMATREALKNRGLWSVLQPKLVYGDNVLQAFQFASSGNAEAVITSWTLLFDKGGILLPNSWHQPIRQAGGVVAASRQASLALRFLDFLTGEKGAKVLGQYGLFPPTPSGERGRKRP
jgi:molybdate transport system substrate-binding protein